MVTGEYTYIYKDIISTKLPQTNLQRYGILISEMKTRIRIGMVSVDINNISGIQKSELHVPLT
jgi:hypothetical protein